MKKIYIAVPTISTKAEGQVHPRLAAVLNRAAQDKRVTVEYVDEYRPIPAARNQILKRFWKEKADWLIMCDLDVVPRHPHWFDIMTSDEKARPIVAGAYAMNASDGQFQFSLGVHAGASDFYFDNRSPQKWEQYDVAGFGCIAISRYILAEAGDECFRDERPRTTKTEDVCFFEDLQKPVWSHPDLICEHWRISDLTRALELQSALMDALEYQNEENSHN